MSIVNFKISRKELVDADLEALFGIKKLPMAKAVVDVEFKGISTAEVNALRRVLCCEMQGTHLTCEGIMSSDKHMIAGYIKNLIECVRLKPQVDTKIELTLNIINNTTEEMKVYTGDMESKNLSEAIFDPTICIAILYPGRSLNIKRIYIATGYGYDDGNFNVASNAAFTHLDIPQHSDAEMRLVGGIAVDESGYKISSMIAKPRHHILKFSLPATGPNLKEIYMTYNDACKEIIRRLRVFISAVKNDITRIELSIDYFEATLVIDETYTIGELIRSKVFEVEPNIAYITYTISNRMLTMVVRHISDPVSLLIKAATLCVELYEGLKHK
jgi:hypothetical protein